MANAGATCSLVAHAAAATSTAPACPYSTPFFKSRKSITGGACRGRRQRRAMMTTCRAAAGSSWGDGDDEGLLWLPRRDVLTGLTGVAAGLTAYPGLASAANEAELEKRCSRGDKVSDTLVKCTDKGLPCPPTSTKPSPVDFKKECAVIHIRKPVHLLTTTEQGIYRQAVKKMKALPESHPLSFKAQAAIHEAYCDGHYRYDPTEKDRPFDVHFSSIFAPWHRMYIFFYERALRALLKADKDLAKYADTFALPYWNWDAPDGMVMPPLFTEKEYKPEAESESMPNPLYDEYRAHSRRNMLVNLDYSPKNKDAKPLMTFGVGAQGQAEYMDAVYKNECTVLQQQIRNGGTPESYLGSKWCAGADESSKFAGSLESQAHTAMHLWVGRDNMDKPDGTCPIEHKRNPGQPNCKNDMGFLGSASRDPLFYSHHANVDRLWHRWATKRGSDGLSDDDQEWRNASFVFYDNVDNPQPVRIRISDVLDTKNLGYTYDDADKKLGWENCKLNNLSMRGKRAKRSLAEPPTFPVTLKEGEVVEVPDVSVPAKQRGRPRELVIQGIEYDPSAQNKFEVAINVPKDKAPQIGPQYKEYAGCFAVVPSSKEGDRNLQGAIRLCIENVLADIKADGGETTVDVLLVPRTEADIKLNSAPKIQIDPDELAA